MKKFKKMRATFFRFSNTEKSDAALTIAIIAVIILALSKVSGNNNIFADTFLFVGSMYCSIMIWIRT